MSCIPAALLFCVGPCVGRVRLLPVSSINHFSNHWAISAYDESTYTFTPSRGTMSPGEECTITIEKNACAPRHDVVYVITAESWVVPGPFQTESQTQVARATSSSGRVHTARSGSSSGRVHTARSGSSSGRVHTARSRSSSGRVHTARSRSASRTQCDSSGTVSSAPAQEQQHIAEVPPCAAIATAPFPSHPALLHMVAREFINMEQADMRREAQQRMRKVLEDYGAPPETYRGMGGLGYAVLKIDLVTR